MNLGNLCIIIRNLRSTFICKKIFSTNHTFRRFSAETHLHGFLDSLREPRGLHIPIAVSLG